MTAKETDTKKGIFLVIEGTDGSGKGTQFTKLVDRLVQEGYEVATFDFPQYDQESSYFVRQYLNGDYGSADEVGPYTGSLFYALDRYQASKQIKQALDEGKVVVANRFTGSNMGHQGTKFTNAEQRRGYFIWLDNLEFQMLGIPRPDRNFVLRVPAETAQMMIDKKEKRSYTDKRRDIHEADTSHMRRAVEVYDDMCNLFPKDFTRVDCVRGDKLMSIEDIHELLWKSIEQDLPVKQSLKKGKVEAVELGPNPYVVKKDGKFEITQAGQNYLAEIVTNTDGNVYGFTEKISPTTVAAAMARLSRRGDDMRITILDEFTETAGKDEKLLQRVITAYGDDSVQQLNGQHIVVENASNLLTKKLEWGRLAAYLEQSTRYIYFDQKDKDGKYRYFVPEYLDTEVKESYIKAMDAIFDAYSEMVHKLTEYVADHSDVPEAERDIAWKGAVRAQACDAARAVLPVATKSTVGIYASGQALESIIMHLLSDELPEAHAVGREILTEARKTISVFLERIDKSDRGGAAMGYRAFTKEAVRDITNELLGDKHSDDFNEPVQLVNVWPRNELDLVPDMLYETSQLSRREIDKVVSNLSYDKKVEIFKTYVGDRYNRRHKPGRAVERAHYSWDLVCDYGIFRDLQRHRMVDDFTWQELTPRYGYEIPQLIEDAGLTDLFEQCFDISFKLYSLLQSSNYYYEAQYATLLGHKMRWKVTYNAREAFHFHELRTSPQGHPGYRKLVQQMHEKLAEVHPLMAESMKFVNQGEDEKLTRLAAERYTQAKLEQLK